MAKHIVRRLHVALERWQWELVDMVVEEKGAANVDSLVTGILEQACESINDAVITLRAQADAIDS